MAKKQKSESVGAMKSALILSLMLILLQVTDSATVQSRKSKLVQRLLGRSALGPAIGRKSARENERSLLELQEKSRLWSEMMTTTAVQFPKQEWTYSDVTKPPSWLKLSLTYPGLPTTKPPPVPQMIPPPPPAPFPSFSYNQAAQPPLWLEPPSWAPQQDVQGIAGSIGGGAGSQYHPYGPPPPSYALASPPPHAMPSWFPLGYFLKPGDVEQGATNPLNKPESKT